MTILHFHLSFPSCGSFFIFLVVEDLFCWILVVLISSCSVSISSCIFGVPMGDAFRVFLLCHPGHFRRCSMNSWLINEPFVQIFSPFPSPTPNSLSRAQLFFLILSPMQVTHSTTIKESQDQNYSQYLLYLNTILTSLSIRHNRCFFKFCLLNSKIRVMLGLFSINCLFS